MTIEKLTDDQIYALEALQRVFGADILYRNWEGLYIHPWQWSSAEHRYMRIPAGTCLDGIIEVLDKDGNTCQVVIQPVLNAHHDKKKYEAYEKLLVKPVLETYCKAAEDEAIQHHDY